MTAPPPHFSLLLYRPLRFGRQQSAVSMGCLSSCFYGCQRQRASVQIVKVVSLILYSTLHLKQIYIGAIFPLGPLITPPVLPALLLTRHELRTFLPLS